MATLVISCGANLPPGVNASVFGNWLRAELVNTQGLGVNYVQLANYTGYNGHIRVSVNTVAGQSSSQVAAIVTQALRNVSASNSWEFWNVQNGVPQEVGAVVGGSVLGSGSNWFGLNFGNTYTVVSGDTLSRIASRFGMTLAQLLAINPQITNPNLINVGQVINVRGTASTTTPSGNASTSTTGNASPSTSSGNSQFDAVMAKIAELDKKNNKDEKSWFDSTFFTEAGKMTGVAIGTLVVVGLVILSQKAK